MAFNPKHRYQVWVPGNSNSKGYHVGTYHKITEARAAQEGCSAPYCQIWDNKARNVDGTLGREVD